MDKEMFNALMDHKIFDLQSNKSVPDASYIQLVAKIEHLEVENTILLSELKRVIAIMSDFAVVYNEAKSVIDKIESKKKK